MLNSNFPARSLALTVLACATPAAAQAASDPKGVWLNDTGRGAIEIKDCGGALCGHVVWVKDGADAKGCGKQIIGDARPAGSTRWDNGWIYSPEKKKRYDVELTPLGEGKLRVVGYAGVKLFSKTMIWKRAPADLQRCGNTETIAKAEVSKPVPSAVPAPAAAVNNAPDLKSRDATSPTGKIPEAKAPGANSADVKPAIVEVPGAKSGEPEAATQQEAAQSQTKSATAKAAEPGNADQHNQGEQETAEADDGGETIDNGPAREKETGNKLNLGDIDFSKFLKKTRSGDCQLDLPWVKIEFGCE